jgi:UDP-N-acetylmuramoylalanine--D-glutamate ligase
MAAPSAVVVGLGATGVSVIRHLQARGWQLSATDTRADPPGLAKAREIAPGMRMALGALDEALLADVDYVVASPGLSLQDPFFVTARGLGLPVIGDIELFARSGARPVAGITGTNGKSTVTTLVAEMARAGGIDARAGGNLGPPALDLLEGGAAGLYVLELSSYQLETTTSLELAAAVVLNVTPDHLDRYADLGGYAGAKARIYARSAVAIVNLDDPKVVSMACPGQRRLDYSLRTDSGADYHLMDSDGHRWLACRGEPLLACDELHVVGAHNLSNALAALAIGEALGLAREPMLRALRAFRGLAHRAEWVADIGGVRYVNDSKGTNVGATLAAVTGLAGPLLLILGGDGKGQDFSPLRAAFAGKVRRALLIGRDAPLVAQALKGVCELETCESLELAVAAAARAARPGDTVLLSPACASLDMFRNYVHRGQVFTAAVQGLAA